jgi:lambda repressor-like predicted transcriptional regulator
LNVATTEREKLFATAALQAAAPIVQALQECDEELRAEALTLFAQLNEGGLDEGQRVATLALLAEILFPNADQRGLSGLDLVESEASVKEHAPEPTTVGEEMDREEATFAERLRALMEEKGLTQEKLAEKLGVGQPAISMMLARECRPQKKTVHRLAEALGVAPEALWPSAGK